MSRKIGARPPRGDRSPRRSPAVAGSSGRAGPHPARRTTAKATSATTRASRSPWPAPTPTMRGSPCEVGRRHDARPAPGGEGAREQRRERRGSQREEQDARASSVTSCSRGRPASKRWTVRQACHREGGAERAARERPARSDSRRNCRTRRARVAPRASRIEASRARSRPASQREQGDVRARDEQQQRQPRPAGRRACARRRPPCSSWSGTSLTLQPAFVVRMLLAQRLGDARELALRLACVDARAAGGPRRSRSAGPAARLRRCPRGCRAARPAPAWRSRGHDAHDRGRAGAPGRPFVRRSPDRRRSAAARARGASTTTGSGAHRGRRGVERGARPSPPAVNVRPTRGRTRRRSGKEVLGHLGGQHHLRIRAGGERPAHRVVAGDALEARRRAAASPPGCRWWRPVRSMPALGFVSKMRTSRSGLRVGQRLQHHRVHHGEERACSRPRPGRS